MPNNKLILSLLFVLAGICNGCSQGENQHKSGQGVDDASPGALNELSDAKSPYLRQHADNPVNWHEWGTAALAKAKAENKPLIISVGYAACHWCHVMEHESFMDTAVARIMNDNFVAIKIDREERPDIDQIYMDAAQLLNGRGGWPLNAFALPDGKPYYAGTYFPKDQWIQVLEQMADIYKNQPEKAEEQAVTITNGIAQNEVMVSAASNDKLLAKAEYDGIFANWQSMIDYDKGGYSRAPKFPLPSGWEFLLQYHYLTGNTRALEAVNTTLTEMAHGGIYDQIGGGFSRYSTDENWFAPHFEKMLYDNAQLVSLYAHAYKVTKDGLYAEVIKETLKFVEREMMDTNGGFYASLNADSEGEEGKFYVWSGAEIDNLFSAKNAELIKDYYNVRNSGNWENGRNILYRNKSAAAFAEKHKMAEGEWQKQLKTAKANLLEARSKKKRPSTDSKVLTSWNALMISAYLDAYTALGTEHYLDVAIKNARFLKKNMLSPDGSILRNFMDGEAEIDAFLDDYALMAEAYLDLYECTFDITWLDLSRLITDFAIAHFRNEDSGMFYYTSSKSETLIARKMEITDNVIPASNSVMAKVLFKLGVLYFDSAYTQMSVTMLNQVQAQIEKGGPYYSNWAQVLGLHAYLPYEVAIMGKDAVEKSLNMQAHYLPTTLFMGGNEENLPLLENKLLGNDATIFVCKARVCQLPVCEVEKALELIE